MAAIDDLTTARDQVAARIKEITASANPDYSEDGASYSKAQYLVILVQRLQELQKAIQVLSGPFLLRSRAKP